MKRGAQIISMSILLAVPVFAANPFLNAKDDKPVSANFGGTEWNDEYINGDIPLTARMVMTRIATMPWGAIFKIEFVDLKSRAEQKREMRPDYFIATADRIVLLNEENNIYGITNGHFKHQEGLWETKIDVKTDLCVYDSSHPSGHFRKIVWKKGVGLIQYDSGYGAAKDGYKLKRVSMKK